MPISLVSTGGNKLFALRKRMMEQTQQNVAYALSSKDAHVIRAVQTSKNLEAIFNLMFEQTLEWYALHFPEIKTIIKDPQAVLGLIIRGGLRSKITPEIVGQFYTDAGTIERVVRAAKESNGGELDEKTLKAIQGVSQSALQLKQEQVKLNELVSKQMVELAPNFSELATPMIAAQLLSKAGSLRHLAALPSSTLQVLGAEEALFSHLKSRTNPPKHGFIFNHPFIKYLPKKAMGKMARTLSGKLAICARVDVFGKERVVDQFKPKLEALFKRLSKATFFMKKKSFPARK